MSLLPTPLYKLESISKEFLVNIYCKRDDLTGFGFGGNKTRKLDFLIADALKKNADTLIAVGANQSNFCRIAAAAGIANGLEAHLVLGGAKPKKPTGNLLLDHIFGARMHHVNSNNWNYWEETAKRLMQKLIKEGRKVYFLPVGGSTPIGALGYAQAFSEIMDDSRRLGISFDAIIHASSSCGTQAGLIAGKELSKWQGKIIGMGVAKNKEILTEEIYDLARQTGKLIGTKVRRKRAGHYF